MFGFGRGDTDEGEGVDGSYDEYLERELRDKDVARAAVTCQIAAVVHDNYTDLVGGMRKVQAVDLDLARAAVHVTNARRGLKRGLERGPCAILAMLASEERRARLGAAKDALELTLGFLVEEERVKEDLAVGKFTEAVSKAGEKRDE
ncbi:unnamed protein product [Choristocarpus tenellus]